MLLTSGGHCLLAVSRDVEDFHLMGTTQDVAPGEAFDKVSSVTNNQGYYSSMDPQMWVLEFQWTNPWTILSPSKGAHQCGSLWFIPAGIKSVDLVNNEWQP